MLFPKKGDNFLRCPRRVRVKETVAVKLTKITT